jgi:hypothetical protein
MGQKPKKDKKPTAPQPKTHIQPDSYKSKYPVWRFGYFDWDGPWGVTACSAKNWRKHIEGHLANIESMTWMTIEQAAGGKSSGHGTNSHSLPRDKFSKVARDRLDELKIHGDSFFSLRLENTVRIYGIREDNCLRIIWFDPYHFKGNSDAAIEW